MFKYQIYYWNVLAERSPKTKRKKRRKKGGYLPFGHIGNLLLYLDPFPATFHQGQCIFASEDKQQKQAGVRKILRKKN